MGLESLQQEMLEKLRAQEQEMQELWTMLREDNNLISELKGDIANVQGKNQTTLSQTRTRHWIEILLTNKV